ncbi:DUF1643 domain-containing protein [Heyndrickxia oleronia]|uniref:DUF1643 domain-containing protein n=1 Tax=Heyndrickxia oleronia TaxID=38875 RepID=A0AAW6SNI2_9BACI|nr:DUF1643 domain-containing protein [Heyndrickxia oleronia]MDH5160360.1 DUF1643 domain-containing protein [Heyndrickxia oleronia]GIN39029.1 hypothetical protein J19TS1_19780 [Heyndrickxia oleronia]
MKERPWGTDEKVSFEFDDVINKKHRFLINCTWDLKKKKALFIMLNPSISDYSICDRTVDSCIYFAKKKNCGSIEIVNLYSYITNSPTELFKVPNKNHPLNDEHITKAINRADYIVAAWGEDGVRYHRSYQILNMIGNKEVYCLGITKYGYPVHPGRLGKNAEIVPYTMFV